MRRTVEYAVRWRREGSNDCVRMFQTRHYALRFYRRVRDYPSAPLEYLRLERRAVGPWEPADAEVPR